MADVNASVPLGFDPTQPPPAGLNLGQAATSANALLQFRQQAQQLKNQNALSAIFADPSNLDPSGMPKPEAISKVMAVDPNAGMALQQNSLKMQKQQTELDITKTDAFAKKADLANDKNGAALTVYEDATSGGMPEPQARAIAQKTYTQGYEDLKKSGLYSEDEIARMNPQFDPTRARANAMKYRDWKTEQQKSKEDSLRDRQERERERHDDALERNVMGGANKWQVLTDPKTNTQYRYNPQTGDSTTLDGKTPYSPEGAAKIGGGAPRSAPAMAVQKYMQEHPDATSEDISQFAANYAKEVSSTRAFGTGKQGDAVRSFNVGISHLNTLDGLVDALANKDMKTLNRISNSFKEEFGSPAPTNFDAAKAIVGDEIIKAIVGGGGALADRENAQNQLDRAKTPEQLKGVIKTYKDLMGGQLTGLKKQYEDTTGKKDFDERLMPETKTELEARGKAGTATPGDLPPAPKGVDPDLWKHMTPEERKLWDK